MSSVGLGGGIRMWVTLMVMLLISISKPVCGAEEQYHGITIIGDQELPTVLYIVPWRANGRPTLESPQLDQRIVLPLDPCRLRKPLNSGSGPSWPCVRGRKQKD